MNIFIMKNGNRLGPFTLAEVNRMRANGEIQNNDWAWHDEIPNWVPLGEIVELQPASPPPVGTPAWPGPVAPPAPTQNPTAARWATAAVIFCISFVVGFFIILILALLIGGGIVGAQAAAAQHALGSEAGQQAAAEAGRAFGKAYGALIMGCSALASLVLSLLLAWGLSFSNLFPWCRRN